MNDTKKLLEVRDLHKAYSKEGVPTKALNGITFDVLNGEYLGIMGASGSGKTTLLNLIGLLDKPDCGEVSINDKTHFTPREILKMRRNFFGYIFQDYLLMNDKTVQENINISKNILKYENGKQDEKDINEILVGRGPGSYTGVRISGTIAKVLALVRNCKLYSFSTLDLLLCHKVGTSGTYIARIVAKKNHSYYKVATVTNKEIKVIVDDAFSIDTELVKYDDLTKIEVNDELFENARELAKRKNHKIWRAVKGAIYKILRAAEENTRDCRIAVSKFT